jgi:abortive infection bacteriophage resistance protein
MIIPDKAQGIEALRRIGYYRLSGYWFPFRERIDSSIGDSFRPKTELSQIVDLYVFDKRLRLLISDALERVEIGLRGDIALHLGALSPWAHRDADTFSAYFRETVDGDKTSHSIWLAKADELFRRSREEFAKHFREKYDVEAPIWIAVESWDFGTVSRLINGLKDTDLQTLADRYHIPRRELLISWVNCLNSVRNACAHHNRVWNRGLINQPGLKKKDDIPLLKHWLDDSSTTKRVYAVVSILQYLLGTIHPKSTWGERLKKLIRTFPSGNGLTFSSSGFPSNWENLELWRPAFNLRN